MRLAILAAALTVFAAAGTAQAGCLTGAAVGGVGGHFAGHHAILGAGAGCLIGHHMAVVKNRDRMVAQGRGYYDAHHHFHRS